VSRIIQAWSATHPGAVRTQNQDACLCRPEIGLFAVADGVGGHSGGEVASNHVAAMLSRIPGSLSPASRLAAVRAGLQQTHEWLLKTPAATGPGAAPATTIVVLMLHEGHFACLWAGDSRAYLLRDGQLCRLTTDHSVVQDLVTAGAITETEAEHDPRQHVITRAVGAGQPNLLIEKAVGEVLPEDRFLLCSDGLYKTLEAKTIAEVLMQTEAVGNAAERLVNAALENRARDNVTAVVAVP
jgi:serine/threonine protein phosphatase Stp1